MITQRTKVQLLVFVLISLLGVAFVGARYAQLDRLIFDETYEVVASFEDSGGVFDGAQVTYRGVTVGEVTDLELTRDGIDVTLSIRNEEDEIPAETRAIVGNRSAVGEQYVELQPEVSEGPYLEQGSKIGKDKTAIPITTTKLLTDISDLAESVDKGQLQTVVTESGKAFAGLGDDLGQLIDTQTAFIETANDNFDLTRALIRDSNTVLTTQVESASALQSFSRDLALFSQTLVDSDRDIRTVIDNGSVTATELRRFLQTNRVDLGQLINNLVTTGEIVVKHIDGVEQILVIYPYVVAGGFTVVAKDPETGQYDAHFGLIDVQKHPCTEGYDEPTRPPQDMRDLPMDMDARCTSPASQTNSRGSQNVPDRAGAAYRSPVIGSYDYRTGQFTWGVPDDYRPGRPAPTSASADRSDLGDLLLWSVGE